MYPKAASVGGSLRRRQEPVDGPEATGRRGFTAVSRCGLESEVLAVDCCTGPLAWGSLRVGRRRRSLDSAAASTLCRGRLLPAITSAWHLRLAGARLAMRLNDSQADLAVGSLRNSERPKQAMNLTFRCSSTTIGAVAEPKTLAKSARDSSHKMCLAASIRCRLRA